MVAKFYACLSAGSAPPLNNLEAGGMMRSKQTRNIADDIQPSFEMQNWIRICPNEQTFQVSVSGFYRIMYVITRSVAMNAQGTACSW